MTDKHQALRDALSNDPFFGNLPAYAETKNTTVTPASLRALLADHDRMREALQNISDMCECCGCIVEDAVNTALIALEDCRT